MTSVGLNNTLVVLSADHGSLPLVENLQRRGHRCTPRLEKFSRLPCSRRSRSVFLA